MSSTNRFEFRASARGTMPGLVVLLLFIAYSCYKLAPALGSVSETVAFPGDAQAILGGFYGILQQVHERGLAAFASEFLYESRLSLGLNGPYVVTTVTKAYWWLASLFVAYPNVYDALVLAFMVMIGGFGYLLLRELGVGVALSLLGSLLLLNLDNFYWRVVCHLSLMAYGIPIAMLWCVLRTARTPTMPRFLALSLAMALTFNMNEYYGYYGVIFSYPLLAFSLVQHHGPSILRRRAVAVAFVLHLVVFAGLMAALYPHLLLGKLFGSAAGGADVVLTERDHAMAEFISNSVQNPQAAFAPYLEWLKGPAAAWVAGGNPVEFSFRIGLLVPLAVVVSALALGAWCAAGRGRSDGSCRRLLILPVWGIPSLLLALMSLNPNHYPSLSLMWLTYKFVPMLRVVTRAWLYIDIAFVVALCVLLDGLLRAWLRDLPTAGLRRYAPRLTAALLLPALFWPMLQDVSQGRALAQLSTATWPDLPLYAALQDQPEGLLAEMPLPAPWPPEPHYPLAIHFSFHHKPILSLGATSRHKHFDLFNMLHGYFNTLTDEVLADFKAVGVRYLVVDKEVYANRVEALRASGDLRVVAEDSAMVVFAFRQWPQPQPFLGYFQKKVDTRLSSLQFPAAGLPSKAGTVEGTARLARKGDGGGVLNFGPYVDLFQGRYAFVLVYSSPAPPDEVVGRWDITRQRGQKTLISDVLKGTKGEALAVICQLNLDDYTTGLEMRSFAEGNADLTVHSWLVVRNPDLSKLAPAQ